MKLQLDCKDVSRLISDGQDLTQPAAERARMRLRLVLCATCRNVSEQFDFLRRAMGQMDKTRVDDEPPVK